MVFPRVVFQKGRFLGIAIANPTTTDGQITLTAYNLDGTLFSGDGVKNAVVEKIPAGSQYARVATQIFNPPASVSQGSAPTRLWVEVTSATNGLTGFFLEGDDQFTLMDGADLSGSGTDLVIPIVENSGSATTELSLVNVDSEDAKVVIDFLRADGTVVSTQNTTVKKRGALQAPLSSLFNISYVGVASLRVRGDRPLVCYGSVFRQSDNSLITVAAQDATVPARTIYFPQLAEGDSWSTGIGVVNLNYGQKTLVTITAYQSDGTLFAAPRVKENPVTQEIPPGGIFRSGLKSLFGFPASPLQTGWIKVEASSAAINGFVEYGAGSDRAVVTAQIDPQPLSIFSHQAMAPPYYTGLALLNPGSLATNVEVYSLTSDGKTIGKTQRVLRPGQKEALLIQQWVPAAAGKSGGSVFMRSDRPVVATQLFGTDNLIALANVPAQRVITNFNPSSDTPRITTVPSLAVVETGKTQQFTVSGVSNLNWAVDGVQGGSGVVGTISNTGLYKAPATAPVKHSLTVQALTPSGDRSGGSSIDVVQRETLTGGLTLVTSVAYLENLQRFFVAEQQLLSSAPSDRYNAAANARISEVSPSGTTSLFYPIPNDTIAKMIPFVDGSSSYLLLAGVDSGKIYRLNVASKQLATVSTGLNKPNSLALDPTTGNLLVSESGANQITVVSRTKILAASAPEISLRAGIVQERFSALAVQSPQGIAIDSCSGNVYVTLADGTLREFQGTRDRVIARGLNQPRQIQVLYREGFSCSDALTLAVAEATQVTLISPRALTSVPLITGLQNAVDVTFFPKGSPFIPGGEASVGLAEGPPATGASRVSQIGVGGIYQSTSPEAATTTGSSGTTGPYDDPPYDTFATSLSAGLSVPDIIAVSSSQQGGSAVITIKLLDPIGAGAQGSITGYIFLHTREGGQILQQILQYYPLGLIDLTFDGIIDLSQGLMISFAIQGEVPVQVRAVGNTISVSVPASALSLKDASAMIFLGNSAEITDIAPNGGGFIKLSP